MSGQSDSQFSEQDYHFMDLALQQAMLAEQQGEVPVGAVLVHDQQVIAKGYNCPISKHDPTAHAEVEAIRHACQRLQNYRLPAGCTLYVTLEPCTQCVGALIHARVERVVFATTEPKAGSLVSARKLLESGYYNHSFQYQGGCLAEESRTLLKLFFKRRRAKRQTTAE